MKKRIIQSIILVIVFIIGYSCPNFIFASVNNGFIATLRNIPQRGFFSDITSTGTLKLMPTYNEIIKRISEEYIGNVDKTKITYSGIHGMLLAFNDPFSNFFEPDQYKKMKEDNEGNFSGIGAVLQMTEEGQVLINEVIEGAPAEKAGLKKNDVIIAVNDKPTAGRKLDDIVKDIRGEEGTKVKLTVTRKDVKEHLNIDVTRAIVQTINCKHRIIDKENGIGYIKLNQFNQNADSEIDNSIKDLEKDNLKGLILDLRGNPGGLLDMAVSISSRFVDSGAVVIIQHRGGIKKNIMVDDEKHNHKYYPLVILVNENSASASEIVSGCVKDHKAGTIVGTTTFGKGLVQSLVPLNDGSAISITSAKYFTPNEIDIHKKGIEPDIFVEESENYDPEKDDTDTQLITAKKVLLNKMGLVPDKDMEEILNISSDLKIKHEKKIKEKEEKNKKNEKNK